METDVLVFLVGMGVTLASCLVSVVYLKTPLEQVLEDLCGTHDERAKFWTVFSTLALVLTPLIFAMSYQPASNLSRPPVFELTNQLRLGLAGLVVSLLALGFMISRFIPRPTVERHPKLARAEAGLQGASAVVAPAESG